LLESFCLRPWECPRLSYCLPVPEFFEGGTMQASVSPPMMQANDAGPEPELFQKKAIKAFRKQGANPLRITRHHIQVNGQVLESLRTIVRMIAELEKLCGVDLLGFLNIFSEQKEATFVHYAKIILEMSHEMLLRGNQAVGSCLSPAIVLR
jgi:hypothetical protein